MSLPYWDTEGKRKRKTDNKWGRPTKFGKTCSVYIFQINKTQVRCSIIHLRITAFEWLKRSYGGQEDWKKRTPYKPKSVEVQIHCLEVFCVYVVVQFLTGSARLFGDRQGDLGEGKDVNLGAILGGRRGQGGEICLVLLSLCVFKLLVQRNTPGLVIHSQLSFHCDSGRQWFNCEDIQMHWGTSTYPYTLVMYIVGWVRCVGCWGWGTSMHASIQTVCTKPVFISSLHLLKQLNITYIILIFMGFFSFTEKNKLHCYMSSPRACSNRFYFENNIHICTKMSHRKQRFSDSYRI